MSALYLLCQKYLNRVSKQKNALRNIFDKQHCLFSDGFKTQQYLLTGLKKWKTSVGKGKAVGISLVDLVKYLISSVINHSLQCRSPVPAL